MNNAKNIERVEILRNPDRTAFRFNVLIHWNRDHVNDAQDHTSVGVVKVDPVRATWDWEYTTLDPDQPFDRWDPVRTRVTEFVQHMYGAEKAVGLAGSPILYTPDKIDFGKLPVDVQYALIYALQQKPKLNGVPGEQKVLLVINGEQYSFQALMMRYMDQVDERIKARARTLAREIVGDKINEKIEKVTSALDDLLTGALQEVDRQFPGARRNDD